MKTKLYCFMSFSFFGNEKSKIIYNINKILNKLLQLLRTTRHIQILPIHRFLILGQQNFELFIISFCYPCIPLPWRPTTREGKVSVNFPAAAFSCYNFSFAVNQLCKNIFLKHVCVRCCEQIFFSRKIVFGESFLHLPPLPTCRRKRQTNKQTIKTTFLMVCPLSITWQR